MSTWCDAHNVQDCWVCDARAKRRERIAEIKRQVDYHLNRHTNESPDTLTVLELLRRTLDEL